MVFQISSLCSSNFGEAIVAWLVESLVLSLNLWWFVLECDFFFSWNLIFKWLFWLFKISKLFKIGGSLLLSPILLTPYQPLPLEMLEMLIEVQILVSALRYIGLLLDLFLIVYPLILPPPLEFLLLAGNILIFLLL